MISVNQRAAQIVQAMMADAEALGISVSRLGDGVTLLDCGVAVPGSLEAGRRFAEACLGGLGRVSLCRLEFQEGWLPGVAVEVSHPVVACMASQYAGWAVKVDNFFAMGSGPARALWGKEPLFERLDYRDTSPVAVLMLEGRTLPGEREAAWIADQCGVRPGSLFLLIAPTASLVGSVQVAARIVETGMHKMLEIDFDITSVLSGFGTCPLAPVAADDLRAIGRTNDAVLYGGQVSYAVRAEDARIEAAIERLPSRSSRDYGTPFYEIFQRYGGDFYKIDPHLFSPAEVTINNLASGRTFHAGEINQALIQKALLQ